MPFSPTAPERPVPEVVGPEPELPRRTVAIAVAGFVVPIVLTVALPQLAEAAYGPFIWLVALVPVFALAYHRGLRGGTLATLIGLVAGAGTALAVSALGLAAPNWLAFVIVAVAYVAQSATIAEFAEMLRQEQREARQLALVDALTRLPNRRHADDVLDREFAAAIRGRRLSVVLWDIDHFKRFNDTHGHAVGDEALRAFADVLHKHTRRQNLSARFGGEEFVSIVTDVPIDGVLIFVDRVRQDLKEAQFEWGPITVSVGVAPYKEGMGSHEVLVAAADSALYQAKENGRDRVEVMADGPRRSQSGAAKVPRDTAARILVVDENDDERQVIVDALKAAGHKVQVPKSASEAAHEILKNATSIDLLVTSLILPRLSGFALVDQMSQSTPELRVVYIADGMRERVSWVGVPGTVTRFVKRPVGPEDIVTAVAEALTEEPETFEMVDGTDAGATETTPASAPATPRAPEPSAREERPARVTAAVRRPKT